MRTLSCWFGGFAIVAMMTLADAQPSQAYVWYPWCANYGGRLSPGTPVCGFTTFAQCMATVSGLQGTCITNPWMPRPYYEGQPRKKRTRQTQR
jgi:hypothetical protein